MTSENHGLESLATNNRLRPGFILAGIVIIGPAR